MKALSIRQPWAWLIVQGYKDVENRTWPTRFRGRIYIHASKTLQHPAFPVSLARRPIKEGRIRLPDSYLRGAIVGEATVVDCVDASESLWFLGPYGFVLADAVAYENPIPYKGRLGFFDVPEEALAMGT